MPPKPQPPFPPSLLKISGDKRIANIYWDHGEKLWVITLTQGWYPKTVAARSLRRLIEQFQTAVPIPNDCNRYFDLRGYRCSIPPLFVAGRKPKRRWHGEVVDQSEARMFIKVRLEDGRGVWIAVGQAKWEMTPQIAK